MKYLLLLVFLILFLGFFWYSEYYNVKEGFDVDMGDVPQSAQSSSIPTDTPGSSTSDPTQSIPQTRDIVALSETVNNFLALTETTPQTNLADADKVTITKLKNDAEELNNQLRIWKQSPTESILTSSDVSEQRGLYENGVRILRNTPASTNELDTTIRAPPSSNSSLSITTVATPPNKISLATLRSLQSRIAEEIQNLNQLRSSSPTLVERIHQLERMSVDLLNMIGSVERGEIKIEDIPISQYDADSFMKGLENRAKPLPSLMKPNTAVHADSSTVSNSPLSVMNNIQPLLNLAKFLKWNLNIGVSYDPETSQRERFMERLETMEKRLTDMVISETPIPRGVYKVYIKELEAIKKLIETSNSEGIRIDIDRHIPEGTRNKSSEAEYPYNSQVKLAQTNKVPKKATKSTADPHEIFNRVGAKIPKDTISTRGSQASFDTSTVGGIDYKKRVSDLCRQIENADLGDSVNFGCIKDKSSVSSTYSWKGNYEMVCKRIGDTWGAWYPEMLGCPKYDPTAKFSGR